MKISIIVPVYNVEKYLERCVCSLLNQDMPSSDYEIILVNDGSTDNSESIAKRLAEKHGNVHLYNQNNGGPSIARNTALSHASGEFIMFADSDDEFMPNIIGYLYNICIDQQLDICKFTSKVQDAQGTCYSITKPLNKFNQIFTGEEALLNGIDVGALWNGVYSRKMIVENKLTFYPGIIHQDSEFNYAAYATAKRIMAVDKLGYVYYYNNVSLTRERSVAKTVHNIKSDVIIAGRLKTIGERIQVSPNIIRNYSHRANSLLLSTLIHLYREEILSQQTKKEIFTLMKEQGLFPIKGRTASIKTTLLVPFVNAYFQAIWK